MKEPLPPAGAVGGGFPLFPLSSCLRSSTGNSCRILFASSSHRSSSASSSIFCRESSSACVACSSFAPLFLELLRPRHTPRMNRAMTPTGMATPIPTLASVLRLVELVLGDVDGAATKFVRATKDDVVGDKSGCDVLLVVLIKV